LSKLLQWVSKLRDERRNLLTQDWSSLWLWLPPLAFLGIFYLYPLVSIMKVSFARGTAAGEGWLALAAPFAEALTSPAIRAVIGFTIGQAVLSTLLTLAFGLPGAYLLARFQFPGKSLILALTSISFVLPTLVVAAAFNAVIGPRGWLNLALMEILGLSQPPIQFINTLWAILIAHVFYNTTIVLRVVGDFWSHLDPRIGQAAQTLGANRWQTLSRVTLPLLMPAISVAALLVFIFDFTSFGVVLVLGGPRFATLEVEIYQQTIGLFNLPLAAALAVIQLAFTLGLTIGYTRLAARLTRPLSLRPRQYTQRRLTSRLSRVLATAYFLALLGLLTLPLLALIARSFVQIDAPRGASGGLAVHATLDYYRELSINRRDSLFYVPPSQAIAISLGYAAATVVLALSLGLPAAWALARRPEARFNRWIDPILMLPLGTSALTLGLGFIVALDRPPLDLRASPLLVPLAHSLVAFPFVVRSLTPSLRSIRPRLREAAAVMGATPGQIFRYIDLPLIGRALLVAATFAFTISIGEFGATALIARPEYPTIPVMIYRFLSQPGALNYGQALALSTLLALATAGAVLAIERFRVAEIGEF
jgi:thiamine transport system permease protein